MKEEKNLQNTEKNAVQNIEKRLEENKATGISLPKMGGGVYATRTTKDEQPSILGIFVGVVAIALALLLTIFALISISNRPITEVGSIDGKSTTRVGNVEKYTFTFDEKEVRLTDGEQVVWYLDDQIVHTTRYHKGDPLEMDFSFSQSGTKKLRVQLGRHYAKDITLNVDKPILNFTIPTYTIKYGDQLPDFGFDCQGFVNDDCIQTLNFNSKINVDCDSCQRLKVGVYTLSFAEELNSDQYESQYTCGTLIVEPREVSLNGYLSKEYDGTNILRGQKLNLVGILSGDQVEAVADTLYFEDKNVSSIKAVSTVNVQLSGEDADNYVLCKDNNNVIGRIYAKRLTLANTTVHSKMFDGTNSATFANIGELQGVVSGDVVALGGIKAEFESSEAGKNKVVYLSEIYLVGSDKENYVIDSTATVKADIATNYLDLLLNKPQVNTATN